MGKSLTYLDLGLFHVLRATESQFPEAWAEMKSSNNYPLLLDLKTRVGGRPNIRAFLASDRSRSFEGNSMM